MEAAGVTVGIIALIGTLKECIDLFSYFSIARSLGRDFEILSTKLDVEKVLLLQWVKRTNLLQPNYDQRLDDPATRATVARVADSIRLLLSDTKILQQRYGVRESQPGNETNRNMFTNRMSAFTRDFEKLDQLLREFDKLDLRTCGHQAATCTKKARWAVRDKDKFGNLLQELSYFVSRLHSLVPGTANDVQRRMAEEDVRPLQDSKAVRLLSEAATGRDDLLGAVVDAHHTETCETRILRCIWYRLMDDRRDALSPPNPQTFEWALDPSAPKLKGDNIAGWLSHGSGIYWICGKAGSGKSTLMKYIYAHPKTKELLEYWAGEMSLTMASFFFWYLGTELQKSLEGLSRALLFKILDSDRSLIQKLLPNMWTDAYASDKDITTPSPAEIQFAFEKLNQIESLNRKFCIFVDGLDEYSGKPKDGAKFLQELTRNYNVKIIISSRPIQPCVQAFSKLPKLYLQDLTAGDIGIYIEQTIFSQPEIHELYGGKSSQTDSLRQNLIKKASGVFLWVVLACRSVQEGLDNFDRLSELERRIDELPPELERLFQHMLGKIEHRYQDRAAKIMRICFQNHLDPNTLRLFTLGLALADDHDLELNKLPSTEPLAANNTFASRLENHEKHETKYQKCKIFEGRLRSHSFGLLEMKRTSPSHDDDCLCSYLSASVSIHDDVIDSTVEFMHRTVFDFLCAGGLAEIKDLTKDQAAFDPNTVLSCISLHLLRLTLNQRKSARHVNDVLTHAGNIDADRYSQVELILITLHEWLAGQRIEAVDPIGCLRIYGKVDKRSWADIKSSVFHLGLFLAVELGHDDLLKLYECCGPVKLSELSLHIPLLWRALNHPITKSTRPSKGAPLRIIHSRYIRVTRYLIACGCNPNEQFLDGEGRETTPWKCFLEETDCPLYSSHDSRAVRSEILDLYMEGGADLNDARLTEFLRWRIADDKAESPRESLATSTQDGTARELYSTNKKGQHMLPPLPTGCKRARSHSPSRLERSKLSDRLRHPFVATIARGSEGLELSSADLYLCLGDSTRQVKLKEGYVAGLEDTLDSAIVGGRRDAIDEAKLYMRKLSLTSF